MFFITADCIECGLCEPPCPMGAISHETGLYLINDQCNGCKGESIPVCVDVCPVDTIVPVCSTEQLQKSLDNPDPGTRLKSIKSASKDPLDITWIERALVDPDPDVRAIMFARNDFTPSHQQIDCALSDPEIKVRLAVMRRMDVELDSHQIELGLNDVASEIRTAVANRSDFIPTPLQIEQGLTDEHPYVRCAFAKRKDIRLSESQISRGLNDKVDYIAQEFRLIKARRNEVQVANDSQQTEEKTLSVIRSKPDDFLKSHKQGASVLGRISCVLLTKLNATNLHLRQILTPEQLLAAMKACFESQVPLLVQPVRNGNTWSNLTVPLGMLVPVEHGVYVRLKRAKSSRNGRPTPAIWPELRGFPLGDLKTKISNWCKAEDVVFISSAELVSVQYQLTDCIHEFFDNAG